ncbi:MAG: hypothetical protein IPP51_02090 [Bacteroidetes bacterium]|nr:hypothetical protein [Bacteroidota bacterium]
MEPEGMGSKESIGILQEFVSEFPYFQTAQALLAKALHEQQHVFISPGEETRIVLPNDVQENVVTETPVITEEKHEEWIHVIPTEPVFEIPEAETEETPVVNEPVSSDDPHEIIRKRLEEILGKKEEKAPEVKKDIPAIPTPVIAEVPKEEIKKQEIIVPESKAIIPESKPEVVQAPELKSEAEQTLDIASKTEEITNDPIGRIELEYAMEATILQSIEKLPLIEKTEQVEAKKEAESEQAPQNFFDWLRSKHNSDFGNVEEVHAEDSSGSQEKSTPTVQGSPLAEPESRTAEVAENPESTQLIDKFIATAPRIVPSKAEFYSPANQAKKSIIEHEDLVSETLAKIYALQGHLMKARSCYVKLSLLNPEKKAYFAALIQEIDNHYNNPDNQDL